jgi:hypothetical protein
VSEELGKSGELRSMANLHKVLNWENIHERYFTIELLKSRRWNCSNDYNERMISLWERTGIDDGVPSEHLKIHLNNETRMYRTVWAYESCGDNFFDAVKSTGVHNEMVKYTYRIFYDNRTIDSEHKNKNQYFICPQCRYKFIQDVPNKKHLYFDHSKINYTE